MTLVVAVVLGVVGVLLSAFFGGTETGFYRVSRIRVQLDAVEGNRISKLLLHLINRPSLFIATILFGNSFANYLISAATVLFVQTVFETTGNSAEILATLLLTPFLFVYAEMFPKYVFMQAPERLLRYVMPLFFVFLIVLLPVTLFIWLLNRGLAFLLGEKHEPMQMQLARRELAKRFDEGQEYGLILPSQRQLTRNVFTVASQSILHYVTPMRQYPAITLAMTPAEMLAVARSHELPEFPVFSDRNADRPLGYVRTMELAVAVTAKRHRPVEPVEPVETETPLRALFEIDDGHSPLNAMLLFQTGDETLALVTDKNGNTLGLVSEKRLMNVLFTGESA
ncbi:MAG: CNNM domain-containing protein [Planctomycetaceae bacterium]|nr:CNNM domain-containing protein [Planctomycetaceae bacterium]